MEVWNRLIKNPEVFFSVITGIASGVGFGLMMSLNYGDTFGLGVALLTAPFFGLTWYSCYYFVKVTLIDM